MRPYYIPPALLTLLLVAALGNTALAQRADSNRCLPPAELKAEHLFGLWTAQFSSPPPGLPARASLLLQRHAEFSDSLAGTVSRELPANAGDGLPLDHAARAALAGDFEEGVLVLDESSDRISITGTWNADMVEGSCGRVFVGLWKDTSKSAPDSAAGVPFRLTRQP